MYGAETIYVALKSSVTQGLIFLVYSEDPQEILIDFYEKTLEFKHQDKKTIQTKVPDPVNNEAGAITPYDAVVF